MGLFDWLTCKMPLPADPAPPVANEYWDGRFQTKDTPDGQFMDDWVLEADGRLVRLGVRYEDHSDPNATGLARFCGMMTAIPMPEKNETVAFHGDLGFHHYDYKTKQLWEYTARFTEGRCTRIWCKRNDS